MYAVIQTGGKQYKVAQGDTLRVEKLVADEGETINFNNVLLVADRDNIKIGTPQVLGGKVLATVQKQGRGQKIKIIKFKRRKHHRKQMGHRQYFTDVKITNIMADGIIPPKTEVVEATPPDSVEATPPVRIEVTPPETESQTTETTPRVEIPTLQNVTQDTTR
jgi:large subunit ribosomal protein L21